MAAQLVGMVRSSLPESGSAPAARNWSRHLRSRLSEMSWSRQACAIVLGPRNDASTDSVFCRALSFR
jgi:hypothetical protein